MTSRVWNEGDPEPKDRPAVVDEDGVTWRWMPGDDDPDYWVWTRCKVTHVRPPGVENGVVLGFVTALDWDEMLGDRGPLREATVDEERNITVAYVSSMRDAS